jgi:pimeloyl-ACP methyl ester carboxylesterase
MVIFVHGFTSHGRYMNHLADYVRSCGYSAALFNYDSYRGIDVAAADLELRLSPMMAPLNLHGYAVVAHSMGGLVALQHVLKAQTCRSALRGVVLLGSPCTGALRNSRVVHYMLDWAEWLTGPNPFARGLGSRAALQLTGNDDERFLDALQMRLSSGPLPTPALSISGGMNYLEFGKSRFSGMIRNLALQQMIHTLPNDGLVAESSADFTRICNGLESMHRNDYDEFDNLNHTFLTRSQRVGEMIVDWLGKKAFLTTDGRSS